MRAGFGEAVVTPPLGLGMAGYFEERKATGVLDDLCSRALVVSNEATQAALVVTDIIHLPSADVDAARKLIKERTGIPCEHVLISATHTHTGPVTTAHPGFHRDERYMREWAERTADAVEQAFHNQVPVTVDAGKGSLPGVAFNRRYRMKNGYVHTNPGINNPDVVCAEGPTDSEVTVLRFNAPDGQPIGILTNFACHPDTVGGNRFSADWIGVAAERLRALIRPTSWLVESQNKAGVRARLGVIVLNGPCGNINHVDVSDPEQTKRVPTPTQKIGVGLADETARVAATLTSQTSDAIAVASTQLALPLMPVTEFQAASRRALADPRVGSMERRRAQANLDGVDFFADHRDSITVEILCLRIGDALIVSVPGELFCELGMHFKSSFPEAFPMVATLSNGYIGYIPTRAAYAAGGYEGRSTRLSPGSGEAIINAGIQLARQVMAKH